MQLTKNFVLQALYDKIGILIVYFCIFKLEMQEYWDAICMVFFDIFSFFFKNKQTKKKPKSMYLIYDGKKENLEKLKLAATKNVHKKNKHYVKCYNYLDNTKFITNLTMIDLFKAYFKHYELKISKKLKFNKNEKQIYFVLTDIVKSTTLWNTNRFKMARTIVQHDEIFYNLMNINEGVELRNEGDSFLVAFFCKVKCLNFAKEFHSQVSKISYDKKTKIGVKIAVNSGVNDKKNYKDSYKLSIEETYQIIGHATANRICVDNKLVESSKDEIFCSHHCE